MRIRSLLGVAVVGSILGVTAASGILAAPSDPVLPAAKQTLEDFAAHHRFDATRADKSRDAGKPLVIQTDPPPDTGLLGPVGAPAPAGVFTPTNAWAGWTTPTTFVQVFAGDSPDHPGRGVVMVVRRTGTAGRLDPTVAPVTTFVLPSAVGGPLRIARVQDSSLILVNPGGRELEFRPATAGFADPPPA